MKRGPGISTSTIPNHPKPVPSIFHSDKLIYFSKARVKIFDIPKTCLQDQALSTRCQ